MASPDINPLELGLFASRINAIAREMGAALGFSAVSPNIKDRLDYSCALFDADGQLIGQATHIPVHLGSMAYAMQSLTTGRDWSPGDQLIVNDPYLGGTHLPDVTLIAPVFYGQSDKPCAFVANRAHHADIGADTPGSMPMATQLEEEGLIIEPQLLIRGGVLEQSAFSSLVNSLKEPWRAEADFSAQMAANRRGVSRLTALVQPLGRQQFETLCSALNAYGERMMKTFLSTLPAGSWTFRDFLDDDGQGTKDIEIRLRLTIAPNALTFDFSGTSRQVPGNVNCPLAVTAAAIYYVVRSLLPDEVPNCAGVMRAIGIEAERGSLVNATRPAAVAAGNVETSMRIADAVMGALAQVLPGEIPAAGQGTMNNVAMGSTGENKADRPWDYYETLAGGSGGGEKLPGLSARQVAMTNTLNTPVEIIERLYPLRITRYAWRRDSGGAGQMPGGDGIVREYEFLAPATVSLLTERRQYAPWGLAGGESGAVGINQLDGTTLPPKCELAVSAGQRLSIATPGGGGFGEEC